MRLGALLDGLGPVTLSAGAETEVTGVAMDSREVRPGDVFVALAGRRDDGRRHVAQALARGARAIVSETPLEAPGVPVVLSRTARALAARAAARLAHDPSASLCLVGVTGTNGKTTTTYLLDGIWRAAGFRTGVVGTVEYRYPGVRRPAPFTTPEAPVLQQLLADMRAADTTHVAMEVSSHGLAMERVTGCRFDAAVFTNLTRDHLDFHADVDAYAAAKARLFLEHLPAGGKPDRVAVLNADDATGRRLAAQVRTRCVRFGRAADADVRALDVQGTLAGTRAVLALGGRRLTVDSPLVGLPHVENVLAAAATAWALGVAPDAIAAGIAAAEPPPGRIERIAGPGFTVVVDYAHTPDALARLLDTLRPLTRGHLITVFGCGGDRDRGKRPLMGEAAARRSDVVVLTSDNPRTEDPRAVLADIEPGVRAAGMAPLQERRGWVVEPDRVAAIGLAVGMARVGDVVIVAGKGHEDYQIIGTEKRHLDDREEVRKALGGRG